MSNYRIYKTEDIEKLMKDIESGSVPMRAKKRRPLRRKLEVRSLTE